MEAVRPILVVAPATTLPFWEGETALWVGDDANVIVYAGSLAARNVMHDHELWLSPGSLDGKSATHKTREVRPPTENRLFELTKLLVTNFSRANIYCAPTRRAIGGADTSRINFVASRFIFRIAGLVLSDVRPASPCPLPQALPQRVPKPDIVITSYEAAASDSAALKAISWEVVLLDERQRGRIGIAKVLNTTQATC